MSAEATEPQYQPGDFISIDSDMTLYAIWEAVDSDDQCYREYTGLFIPLWPGINPYPIDDDRKR
jgi:hypothetical protein